MKFYSIFNEIKKKSASQHWEFRYRKAKKFLQVAELEAFGVRLLSRYKSLLPLGGFLSESFAETKMRSPNRSVSSLLLQDVLHLLGSFCANEKDKLASFQCRNCRYPANA